MQSSDGHARVHDDAACAGVVHGEHRGVDGEGLPADGDVRQVNVVEHVVRAAKQWRCHDIGVGTPVAKM